MTLAKRIDKLGNDNFLKFKGIWFYGPSGAGKTLASKFVKKIFFKSIILDGDLIRRYISFDLGYSEKDRITQIKRVYGMNIIALKSIVFTISSTVYMNNYIANNLKKKKIVPIKISRHIKKIKNRKKIYNTNFKNVVGKDIKAPYIKNEKVIYNNGSKQELKKKIIKLLYER